MELSLLLILKIGDFLIAKLLIDFSFYIERAKKYQKIKDYFRNILTNSDFTLKRYIDLTMIFFILSSVIIIVYDVKYDIPLWMLYYDIYFVTSIFLIEYILRMWIYSDLHIIAISHYQECQFLNHKFSVWFVIKKFVSTKLNYMKSPIAIIDLLAILPLYRPLRIFRIFILFRVFKLFRYSKNINEFFKVLAYKKFEFITLLILLLLLVLISTISIYLFEYEQNKNINSLIDSLYWSIVTISTVGYGDITPITDEGKMVSMVIIFSGVSIITFITSITVSLFSQKLNELKDNKMIYDINKNKNFLIICGYTEVSRVFLNNYNLQQNYIIIDKNPLRVQNAIKDGYSAINDDLSRYDVISKFNTNFSNIIILSLINSDIENIYITLNAKALSKDIKVIAKCNDNSMIKKYTLAKCDHILLPNHVATTMLITAIKQPNIYQAIYNIITGSAKSLIDEVIVSQGDKIVTKRVEEIPFKENKLLFIGVLKYNSTNFIFNPAKEFIFSDGDTLLLMGYDLSLQNFKKINNIIKKGKKCQEN